MSNVRCSNAGSNVFDELFILSLITSGGVGGTFNTGKVHDLLMENCEVDSVAPGFEAAPIAVTPIAINGSYAPSATTPGDGWVVNGRITGCTVHGVIARAVVQSIQMSLATRSIVENCTVYGNSGRYAVGFYSDTGSLKSISVSHNTFLDTDVGVRILCDSASFHSDVSIFANLIRMRGLVNGAGKSGIEYAGKFRTTRARVIGNRFELLSPFAGSIGIYLGDETAPFVLANTVSGFALPMTLPNATEAIVRSNTDASGLPIGTGLGGHVP